MLNPEQQPGMRVAGSGTWAGIANTHFWIDPGTGVTGAIYTQTLPFGAPDVYQVYARFRSGPLQRHLRRSRYRGRGQAQTASLDDKAAVIDVEQSGIFGDPARVLRGDAQLQPERGGATATA